MSRLGVYAMFFLKTSQMEGTFVRLTIIVLKCECLVSEPGKKVVNRFGTFMLFKETFQSSFNTFVVGNCTLKQAGLFLP